MIRSHFAGDASEQGDILKRQFPKDGVRRVNTGKLPPGGLPWNSVVK